MGLLQSTEGPDNQSAGETASETRRLGTVSRRGLVKFGLTLSLAELLRRGAQAVTGRPVEVVTTVEAAPVPPTEEIRYEMLVQATRLWYWGEMGAVFDSCTGNAGVADMYQQTMLVSGTARPSATQTYLARYDNLTCIWEDIPGPGSPENPNRYGYFNDAVTLPADGTSFVAYTEGDPASVTGHSLKLAQIEKDGTLGAITDAEVEVRRNSRVSAFALTFTEGTETIEGFGVLTQYVDSDTGDIDLQLTRHRANGERVGEKITVTTGDDNEWPAESGPAVAADGTMYFAFTNQKPGDTLNTYTDVYIQRIGPDGSVGPYLQVTTEAGEQSHPQIAILDNRIYVLYEHVAGQNPEDRHIRCAIAQDDGTSMSIVKDERIAYGPTDEELGGDRSMTIVNMRYKRKMNDETEQEVTVPVMMVAGSRLREATDPDSADAAIYFVDPETLQQIEVELKEGEIEELEPLFIHSTSDRGLYAPSIRVIEGQASMILTAHEYAGDDPEGHRLNQVVAFRVSNKFCSIFLPLTVKEY